MQVNQRDLEYISAVVQHQSFSRAAQACNVTQPALSNQIKRIETRIGLTLFDRKKTGISLTDAGGKFMDAAASVLVGMQEMSDLVKLYSDPLAVPIRIGIFPTVAPYMLPTICDALRREFEGVQLVFSEQGPAVLLDNLIDRKVDIAMMAMPQRRDGVETVDLYDEELYLTVHKDHPLAGQESVEESELPYRDIILLAGGHCLKDSALALCKDKSVGSNLPSDLSATSLETLVQYVSKGMGCTLLPAMGVEECKKRDLNCAYIRVNSKRFIRTIGFAYRSSCPRLNLVPGIVEALGKYMPPQVISLI